MKEKRVKYRIFTNTACNSFNDHISGLSVLASNSLEVSIENFDSAEGQSGVITVQVPLNTVIVQSTEHNITQSQSARKFRTVVRVVRISI